MIVQVTNQSICCSATLFNYFPFFLQSQYQLIDCVQQQQQWHWRLKSICLVRQCFENLQEPICCAFAHARLFACAQNPCCNNFIIELKNENINKLIKFFLKKNNNICFNFCVLIQLRNNMQQKPECKQNSLYQLIVDIFNS